MTIELVGEFLGIDTDEGIYRYFRRHYTGWFPALGRVHRTTFARQAANPWKAKELLWRALLASGGVEYDPKVSLVDSFAVPVCSFAKAPRCKGFAGEAAYGHDAMNKGFFYGFRAHLRVCWPGVIVAASLAPANEHDRWVVESDLFLSPPPPPPPPEVEEKGGWLLGDTNYSSPTLTEELRRRHDEVSLVAPKKTSVKRERHPWPRWLIAVRRRIETVASQLVERYRVKRVRARDRWHLTSRFLRKVLSHTCCVLLCQREGLSPLRFSELITH